jgi:hypothetical protein
VNNLYRIIINLIILTVMSLSAVACAQASGPGGRVPDADFEAGRVRLAENQALMIAAIGNVRASSNTEAQTLRPVAAGDILLKEQIIVTGDNSSCEMQLGTAAVVRLEEKTEVRLEEISLKPREISVALRLQSGAILCRAAKLAERERFLVRTASAVCSVRGAEFRLSLDQEGGTVLAVRTGKAALLALTADLGALEWKAARVNAAMADTVGGIAGAGMIVGENEQALATEEEAKAADARLREIEGEVDKLAGQMTISPDEKKAFGESVRRAGEDLRKLVKAAAVVDEAHGQPLERIKSLRLIPLAVVSGDASAMPSPGAPDESAADKLIRVFIKASPSEARISLNGEILGQGSFYAILPAGGKFAFAFSAPGYLDKSLALVPDTAGQKSFEIILDKKAEAALASTAPKTKNLLETSETVVLWDSFEDQISWRTGHELWNSQQKDSALTAAASENFAMPGRRSLMGTFFMNGFDPAFYGTAKVDQDWSAVKGVLVAIKNAADKDLSAFLVIQLGGPDRALYQTDGVTVKAGRSASLRFEMKDLKLRTAGLAGKYAEVFSDFDKVIYFMFAFTGEVGLRGMLYIDNVRLVKSK